MPPKRAPRIVAPNGELEAYLKEASRSPLLSRDEEITLARVAQSGGPEADSARKRFLNANLKLVVALALKYKRYSKLDLEDLVQEGNIGLMRALEKFDPDRGFKFSTYASWWIRQAISRSTHMYAEAIRIPVYRISDQWRVPAAKRELYQELRREPSQVELAARLGFTLKRLAEVLALPAVTHSFEDHPFEDSDITLVEILPDEQTPDPEEAAFKKALSEQVLELTKDLDPRSAEVLALRFVEEKSLQEIGDHLDLSRERVRQIIKENLKLLGGRGKSLRPWVL